MSPPSLDEFSRAVATRAPDLRSPLRAIAQTVEPESVRSVQDQLTAELQGLLAAEREGDTSQQMASGPVDPDAPKQAGFERPARSEP